MSESGTAGSSVIGICELTLRGTARAGGGAGVNELTSSGIVGNVSHALVSSLASGKCCRGNAVAAA